MGKYNICMQEYLQDKIRFADLFNGVLFQGQSVIRPEALSSASEQYAVKEQGAKRKDTGMRTRDIKMQLRSGTTLRILAIENQAHVDYSMPLRCMEYDTLEYIRQLKERKQENHDRLQRGELTMTPAERLCGLRKTDRLVPVYTICLYHGKEPWDGPLKLQDLMDFEPESDRLRSCFADYPLRLFCVNGQEDFEVFRSDLKELFRILNCRTDRRKMSELIKEDAYRHLSLETLETISIMVDIPAIMEHKERYLSKQREEYNMCQAWQELLEEREAAGILAGREKGKLEGKRQCIHNMLLRGFSDEDIRSLTECDQELIEEVRGEM